MKKSSKQPSKTKQFFSSLFDFYMGAEIDITSVAVAYYLIISLLPILMTLANLLPYLHIDVDQILVLVKDLFPHKLYPTVANMVTTVLTRPSSSWLGISILTTLWTISKSMDALQKAFNKAYGVSVHRDFIISRLVGMILGIALQLIITASVIMIAFGKTFLQMLERWVPLKEGFWMSLLNQTQPIVYFSLFLALVMLYFFVPNVKIRKIHYALPGVLFVMAVMGSVGKLFALYVESYADRLMDFRFVTAVILLVLMLWFVFMSNVLILGAVLNATVQSLHVEAFATRRGDVASVLNRIKQRFTKMEDK